MCWREVCGYIRRMPQRNILVVAIDGLRASALGAYGNTTFATPAFDRFAAESIALDWCYALSSHLSPTYRALWQSRHPLRAAPEADAASTLPGLLAAQGFRTTLITDEPELAVFSAAANFDNLLNVTPADSAVAPTTRVDTIADTSLARLFSAACDVVAAQGTSEREPAPQLVWIHSRGMYGAWDAPLELQETMRDEEDPPPIQEVAPPNLILADDHDPDVVFRYSSAYAGQVIALDACWSELIQAVEHAGTPEWLVVLVGVRGYSLGEHARIGGVDPRLYAEQLHVPALVRFPSGLGRLRRTGDLASHLDLLPTLADWSEVPPPPNSTAWEGTSWLPLARAPRVNWREALVFGDAAGSRAIRTAAWSLRRDATPDDGSAQSDSLEYLSELFVRPDDRWEANNVAKLCPDIVDELTDAIDDAQRQLSC